VGDPRGIAFSLNRFGEILLALKRYDEAHAVLQESLDLSNVTGNRMDRGEALNVLGQMASAQAQHAEAERLLHESLALLEEIGYPRGIAQAHIDLGNVAYARGDHQTARRHFAEALHTAATAHLLPLALDALSKIAMLLIDDGASERALALCAHILHSPAATHATREHTIQLRAKLLATMPPHQAVAAEERGRTQPLDALVADVLQNAESNAIIS
jgi:tetratricopeptide (TPR) repeat protein